MAIDNEQIQKMHTSLLGNTKDLILTQLLKDIETLSDEECLIKLSQTFTKQENSPSARNLALIIKDNKVALANFAKENKKSQIAEFFEDPDEFLAKKKRQAELDEEEVKKRAKNKEITSSHKVVQTALTTISAFSLAIVGAIIFELIEATLLIAAPPAAIGLLVLGLAIINQTSKEKPISKLADKLFTTKESEKREQPKEKQL